MTDLETLTDRLRRGETRALDELWTRFGPDLRRRARTRLRQMGIASQAESMDVCNAVLVDLARQGQIQLERPAEVIHYLLRAIDNQVRDTFRTLSRQRRDFRRNESLPVEEHPLRAMQTTPSQHLLRSEVINRVREELGQQHAPIVDMVLENFSWAEIGERMGIAPDTARMRYRRAIRVVKEAWLAGQESIDDEAN
ncbi:RNA polymerase sigma factor [Roseimaritima ulvae]|uniref:RNA polymerase sigma factor n=1 Tax=Roseimaritima ulvae TaxID=980254 RepID=A0A5B9QT28_9BACT|nr:sigma-70 family RNA polymerase sigma factor [Roseimaritima ulvae]QEG41062.1 RNA polymerase sigma factor [Roseimaritima ulvae]